jgi:MFS transporter, putative metabolite:H+ symporter
VVTSTRQLWSFWIGLSAVTGGVLLHLPMFVHARPQHYVLRGMPFDPWMAVGMALILVGYGAVVYGLVPGTGRRPRRDASGTRELTALDSVRLGRAHVKLMLVLVVAIAVDTQKPFTFTFILPGVASEYGLSSPTHPTPGHWPVALLPLSGILGTVVGSLVWGHLGDRIGRRAAILLAGTVFIGTAMCGSMPAYWQNIATCFVMGLGAGGLLPIAYSLLTEMIPARRRGEIVVLVGGFGTALGFLVASWSADWLMPTFGWRIMWWLGLPTGLVVLLLNRYVPESPRFLLATGRADEARAVMRTFGIVVAKETAGDGTPEHAPEPTAGLFRLFRAPYTGITLALAGYGLAWGLVNFGFLVWMPLHVGKSGIGTGGVTAILAKAALLSIPGSLAVSWFYGRRSSKGALIGAAALETAVLAAFAARGDAIVRHTSLFTALVVVLLVSMWATISTLGPYSAEVYPTRARSAGAGIAAGASKLGGVLALAIAAASVAPPSLAGAALLGAVPAGLAALMLVVVGVETSGRRLEEIAPTAAGDAAG